MSAIDTMPAHSTSPKYQVLILTLRRWLPYSALFDCTNRRCVSASRP